MQRYFVPREQWETDTVRLTGDDAHHLIRVMRAKPGDAFIVSDGESREALAEFAEAGKNDVTARLIEPLAMDREACVRVWIAQSLPKGDKFELVIQKCTELGAVRFLPFASARTVVQYDDKKEAKRLERWRKIAKEAAEQAHRNRIPRVDAPCSWRQLLETAGEADAAWLCYEGEDGLQLGTALKRRFPPGERRADREPVILIAIGPEGGFDEQEVREAAARGWQSVGLGKRVLRTETAGMAALTAILYEFGEMGG